MLETIRQLFAHDEWANARILGAVRSAPHLHQKTLQILAHLLVSEKVWLQRLKGEDTSAANKSPEFSYDDCEKLAAENQKLYAEFLGSLDEDNLRSPVTYKNFKNVEFRTPVGEILMHVAVHGTYHRGQVTLSIREEGGTPVNTDFITFVRESSGGQSAPRA